MSKGRPDSTRWAEVPSGEDLPAEVLDWLDAFARLIKRFPKTHDFQIAADGQGNVHAYLGEEEINGLQLNAYRGRFFGED